MTAAADLDAWARLETAAARHRRRFEPEVTALQAELSAAFGRALRAGLAFLLQDGRLAPFNQEVCRALERLVLERLALELDLCHLMPPLAFVLPLAHAPALAAAVLAGIDASEAETARRLFESSRLESGRWDPANRPNQTGPAVDSGESERLRIALGVLLVTALVNELLRRLAAAGETPAVLAPLARAAARITLPGLERAAAACGAASIPADEARTSALRQRQVVAARVLFADLDEARRVPLFQALAESAGLPLQPETTRRRLERFWATIAPLDADLQDAFAALALAGRHHRPEAVGTAARP